jgi:CubicO group peptidase (beta-lactamase class C family)
MAMRAGTKACWTSALLVLCELTLLPACAGADVAPKSKSVPIAAPADGADLPQQIPSAALAGEYDCGRWWPCPLGEFMWRSRVCALLVVKAGTIVYENYAPIQGSTRCKLEPGDPDNGRDAPYGLASITKSFTSTLLGLLIARNQSDPTHPWGDIDLAKPVGHYVPALTGAAARPSLEQALRMRSGFIWDDRDNLLYERTIKDSAHAGEPFADAASDLAQRSEGPPAFNYSGLDTTLAGLTLESLLQRHPDTAGWHLSDLLAAWIWQPLRMKYDARWKMDASGTPAPFCCLYMRARDLAKFGQFILENATAPSDSPATPLASWMLRALRPQGGVTDVAATSCPGYQLDYGYQWWPFVDPRHGFLGLGIHGQMLHIFPREKIVIVQFSTMPAREELALECASYHAHSAIVDSLSR